MNCGFLTIFTKMALEFLWRIVLLSVRAQANRYLLVHKGYICFMHLSNKGTNPILLYMLYFCVLPVKVKISYGFKHLRFGNFFFRFWGLRS